MTVNIQKQQIGLRHKPQRRRLSVWLGTLAVASVIGVSGWAAARATVKYPITVDGQTVQVPRAATTVRDALAWSHVALGPLDQVEPGMDQPIRPGMAIAVTRVEHKTRREIEKVPHSLTRRPDDALDAGEERVMREGEDGQVENIYVDVFENGQFVRTEKVARHTVKEPVNQVIAYGGVKTISRGGQNYLYRKAIRMTATAYTAGKESNPWGDGTTYLGMKARRGIAAVDPRVIPLGSRLYIEGYGYAIAGDIGGAIKGARIDLCMDSLQEALNFGVQPVTVYLLE